MHPLLKRWLNKCHQLSDLAPCSGIKKGSKEQLKPVKIPTKYVCEELASEYATYWLEIQENNGKGLEEIQKDAMARWYACRFQLGVSTEQYPLPLDLFVEVFDDYFFLGSLRQCIKIQLADATHANSNWIGLTTSKKCKILSGPPEIQIELKRLPDQLWTTELIQDVFDTLLHEMSHAFLMIYSSPAGFLGGWRHRRRSLETDGLTGHGPCWVKVASAIAKEADRSLGRVWDKWDLGIEDSCCLEKEALREP